MTVDDITRNHAHYFGSVDDRYGHPSCAFVAPPLAAEVRAIWPKGRAVRVETDRLAEDLAVLLDRNDLVRAVTRAADDLARRLFADTPLALASIVRTGIVPWDIEYQTTTDRGTLERVTRLVEYERGGRRG